MAYGHAQQLEYPDYGQSKGAHWGKRAVGYAIDSIVALGFAIGVLMVLLGLQLIDALWINIAITAGLFILLMFLYPALLEILIQRSLGKIIVSYVVISKDEDTEEELPRPTAVQAIMRNLIKLTLFIPVIGGILSMNKEEDWRSRGLVGDDVARTDVIPYFGPKIIHVKKRSFIPPEEVEEEEMEDEYENSDLPFPEELLKGECPRCGTPYRITPDGFDNWDGLWNYKCVWCNYPVLEGLYNERTRPGFE